MKLDVRHFYPCSVDTFWEMYWDDAYDEMLQESSTVQRKQEYLGIVSKGHYHSLRSPHDKPVFHLQANKSWVVALANKDRPEVLVAARFEREQGWGR